MIRRLLARLFRVKVPWIDRPQSRCSTCGGFQFRPPWSHADHGCPDVPWRDAIKVEDCDGA